MYVEIDDTMANEMLADRVKYWRLDRKVESAYIQMFGNMIDNGYFDGSKFDVNQIVDNMISNATIVERDTVSKETWKILEKSVGNLVEELDPAVENEVGAEGTIEVVTKDIAIINY